MKTNKRFLALCLALLLVCAVLPAPTAQGADVQPVLSAALAHQAAAVPSPGYGDEWTVLGLARGGYFAVDSDYFARYYADLAAKAPELTAASGREGALNAYKSTDNSRVILALSAIGRDATQDLISARAGRSGRLPGVSAKTAYSKPFPPAGD